MSFQPMVPFRQTRPQLKNFHLELALNLYQKRPSIKHTEGKYIILIKRYGKLLRCSLKNPALNKAKADACGDQL